MKHNMPTYALDQTHFLLNNISPDSLQRYSLGAHTSKAFYPALVKNNEGNNLTIIFIFILRNVLYILYILQEFSVVYFD